MAGRVAILLLIAVIGLADAACRGSRGGSEPASTGRTEGDEPTSVEDSGRTLSGSYLLKSVKDEYSPSSAVASRQVRLTFDNDGRFQKQESSNGQPAQSEEGTYVVGTHNELVLYVEKADSQALPAARVERYTVETNDGNSLSLRYNSSGVMTFQKQ